MPARAQTCPAEVVALPKSSSLYLYFPTASDATFPSYGGVGVNTSPVAAFDMASHDASISTAAVRTRVLDLMRAGYCEFDIGIQLATTTPAPAEPRWQIIGIGSDGGDWDAGHPAGKAQAVDTGDADSQDYCRVWVETIEDFIGTDLTGANSTLERWATAIANISAHEGGHNYGGAHGDSAPEPTEDASENHIMANPAFGATAQTIVDRLNHHSDKTYERFGHDVGLTVKTLHNWDFINPNSTSANSLTVTVLSSASSLSIAWYYTGSTSPWTSPTVTKRAGTISFRGTAYNVFDVKFATAKAWSGGAAGVVPAGETFHTGASFAEPDAIIVYETTLENSGTQLPLRPRLVGYDAGTDGSGFSASFVNTGNTELMLSNVEVFFLPRMLDLEQMVVGGALRGIRGEAIAPYGRRPRGSERELPTIRFEQPVRLGSTPFVLPIAELTDRRHLDVRVNKEDCGFAKGPGFSKSGEIYCPTSGYALSLFPATFVYIIATVTEPNAHYWDKTQAKFVDGPLSTRIFFQRAGVVPDANRNGHDDLIDIRDGSSSDGNSNGIPDDAERKRYAVFARLGVAIPEDSRALDPGLSAAVGVEAEITNRFSVLGTLGMDQFDPNFEIRRATLSGRMYLRDGVPLLPYLEAGAGLYDADPGSSEAGVNAGLGVRWDFRPALSLEGIAQRHHVKDFDYWTVQLGLRWQL